MFCNTKPLSPTFAGSVHAHCSVHALPPFCSYLICQLLPVVVPLAPCLAPPASAPGLAPYPKTGLVPPLATTRAVAPLEGVLGRGGSPPLTLEGCPQNVSFYPLFLSIPAVHCQLSIWTSDLYWSQHIEPFLKIFPLDCCDFICSIHSHNICRHKVDIFTSRPPCPSLLSPVSPH